MGQTSYSDIPGPIPESIPIPLTISATTSAPILLWRAPFKSKITKIVVAAQAAVAASDTNYWTIEFINRGPAGDGTTAVNAATTTKAASLNALAAYIGEEVTIHATAANSVFAAGDLLTLTLTKAASADNIVMPLVYIEYEAA